MELLYGNGFIPLLNPPPCDDPPPFMGSSMARLEDPLLVKLEGKNGKNEQFINTYLVTYLLLFLILAHSVTTIYLFSFG